MITKPLPFQEAIRFLLEKEQLPADWDAAMWQKQEPDFQTQAFFVSRVENARFLDRAQGLIFDYMAKVRENIVQPDGTVVTALKVGDREHFVQRMRDFMISEGMADRREFKDVNQKDVTDIRSLARLRLIFDTNVRQAYGFGQWKQGMTPAALRAFPAARLIRDRGVKDPRPRHQSNLGEVRLKTDPRWAEYHNAREIGGFGVPWGPYGFNSGVTQEDVSKSEARALGLNVDSVAPVPAKITDGTQASTKKMNPALKAKLLAELRNGPKPLDASEVARKAAADTRRIMLNRGLADAEAKGNATKAAKYRKAIAELPLDAIKVVDTGDAIQLGTQTAAVISNAGSDIGPKLLPLPGTPKRAEDALATALQAIDMVHGDGPLPDIKFHKLPASGSNLAFYSPHENSASQPHIALRKYDHGELSIVHEVGHWLDHMAFGPTASAREPFRNAGSGVVFEAKLRSSFGSYGPEFDAFRQAVKASEAYRFIQSDFRLTASSREYLLSEHELFARAYAQFIAKESGDPILLRQVEEALAKAAAGSYTKSQWDWNDFGLVSESIREIFKARGWMRT